MSNDHKEKPAFKAPALTCDSHLHIFGPADRYPPDAGLRYPLPCAPLDEYKKLASHLGIERMVFVQPSAYGRDNRCMLDAMQEMGPDLCRGIVDIEDDIPDAELTRMHAVGVRGVRINTSPTLPHQPDRSKALIPRVQRLDARCFELGWHLDFLGPGWLTTDLMPTFKKLKVNYSVAHMGMFLARDGIENPQFQKFLDFLRNDNGQCWVKFTGIYRMSIAPGYIDVTPMARSLIEAAPNRVIWGSDFPHISFADKTSSVDLFNLLAIWAPDERTRSAILVDNPKSLFGF